MRILLAVGVLLSCVIDSRGDDVAPIDDSDTLVWQEAFSPAADDALVAVMITNDDPVRVEKSSTDATQVQRRPWCGQVLATAIRKVREQRPDLQDRLALQSIAAGMPAVLTGGEPRNQPARAIIAICDGNYRLLGLAVGVPDADGLLALIEDAEETRLLNKMHADARQEIVTELVRRNSTRVSRMWRKALEQAVLALGNDADASDTDDPKLNAQRQLGRLRVISDTLGPTYLADVQLRFGLSEAADRTRLVILEQHPEARRPWCQTLIPFFAGEDFQTLWKPLCESVWGLEPISDTAVASDLLAWWDANIETETIVLALQSAMMTSDQALPALPKLDAGSAKSKSKRGVTWQDIQTLAVQHSYRSVTAEQLSVLLRERDLRPIDIQLPTTAKYLVFRSGKNSAVIIREGDRPAKFAGLLK